CVDRYNHRFGHLRHSARLPDLGSPIIPYHTSIIHSPGAVCFEGWLAIHLLVYTIFLLNVWPLYFTQGYNTRARRTVFRIKNYCINRWISGGYSYVFEPSLEPLSAQTVGQLIATCAEDSPDRTAVVSVHQNISKTYGELNSDANKLAMSLRELGCGRGDRVGIWAPNCYEWLLTQYGTAKIGAIMVNVNPGYRASELQYALNLVGCHTLICSQRFRSSNYCEIMNDISPELLGNKNSKVIDCEKIPSLKNIVMINSAPNEPDIAPTHVTRFDDLLTPDHQFPGDDPAIQFDDPINIQFTSGTTGHPKGATLTHHSIIQNAWFVGKRSLEGLDPKGLR
ncbi:unnamed protein product, partial [Oppiella nova]